MMKRSIQAALIACLLASILGCPNPAGGDPTSSPAGTDATPSPASTPSPAVPAGPSLSSITLSGGLVLSPAFNPNTLAYTVRVPNEMTSLTVSGTAADSGSSVSAPVTLSGLVVGVSQTATLTVTAQDSTARSYTVAATRWPVVPPASENLLLNGGFDEGLFGWIALAVPGATVDASVEGGELRIEGVATASHYPGDFLVASSADNAFALRRNKTYTLSYDAYSAPGGSYLSLNFLERGRDLNGDGNLHTDYAQGGYSLTGTKTSYSFSFVMGYPDDDQVELQLQAGGATSPVFVDNIVLRETGDGSIDIAGDWVASSNNAMPIQITNGKVLSPPIGMDADILFYNNKSNTLVIHYLSHPGGPEYAGLCQRISWTEGEVFTITTYLPSSSIAGALAATTIEDETHLLPHSDGIERILTIPGNGSINLAWFDQADPDTVSIRVSWSGGSATVPIGTQTFFIDGFSNGEPRLIRLDSLSASSTVLASSYAVATPSASATPGAMDLWVGPSAIEFGHGTPDLPALGYVQAGATADISRLDADLALTYDVSVANQYLAIFIRNKFAKVDSIEYLDSGGNVVGYFNAHLNGEIAVENQSNIEWGEPGANVGQQDGEFLLLGWPDWYSSIGMRYGAGVDFTRIRIRLLAD